MCRGILLLALGLGLAAHAERGGASPEKQPVTVAAVQLSGYDKVGNIAPDLDPVAAMLPYIERAGREEVDLLVFPEYHLGRIRIPGPETKRIGAAVREQALYVVAGSWELLEGGKYANAALLFGRDGELAGRYYKTHAAVDKWNENKVPYTAPPPRRSLDWFVNEDPEWIMKKGEELPVFELDFGRVGILTCYDGWFPEPWRILSLKGAELIVWINGRHGGIEDFLVKSAMFRNEVHVMATNQAYGGGTMIGQYPFKILERMGNPGEGYIRATLDMARLRNARAHSRNLAQRRPDLYGILAEPLDRARYLGK